MDGALKRTDATGAIARVEPHALVSLALEKGADPAVLEKLLDLQQRWEANEARKAFAVAMAAFRAEAPDVIPKDAKGHSSKYANLASVVRALVKVMSKHGLTHNWYVDPGDVKGEVRVRVRITHVLGHYEETSVPMPYDDSRGNMNSCQRRGSAFTYGERYSFLALVGIATDEMDDDGQASGEPTSGGKRRQAQQPEQPVTDAAMPIQVKRLKELRAQAAKRSGDTPAKIVQAIDAALAAHGAGTLTAQYAGKLVEKAEGALRKAKPAPEPDPETGELPLEEPPLPDDEDEREPGEEAD